MLALLRKAFTLRPPPALRWRLLRWMAGAAAREFAFGLLLLTLLAGVIGILLGALRGWFGIVVELALLVWALWVGRLAWQSLTSARKVRDVLADLEPPADEEHSDFPISNLLLPPLML